jgi:hypothetical protein
VIVAGFGRFGQIATRLLIANGFKVVLPGFLHRADRRHPPLRLAGALWRRQPHGLAAHRRREQGQAAAGGIDDKEKAVGAGGGSPRGLPAPHHPGPRL